MICLTSKNCAFRDSNSRLFFSSQALCRLVHSRPGHFLHVEQRICNNKLVYFYASEWSELTMEPLCFWSVVRRRQSPQVLTLLVIVVALLSLSFGKQHRWWQDHRGSSLFSTSFIIKLHALLYLISHNALEDGRLYDKLAQNITPLPSGLNWGFALGVHVFRK